MLRATAALTAHLGDLASNAEYATNNIGNLRCAGGEGVAESDLLNRKKGSIWQEISHECSERIKLHLSQEAAVTQTELR